MSASGPRPECAGPSGGTDFAPPLWERLLGTAALAALPPRVRRLHHGERPCRYAGTVTVQRGTTRLARFTADCLRLPPAGTQALQVDIVSDPAGERWLRRFGEVPMASRLGIRDGRLIERLGLMTLAFRLTTAPDGLHWTAESLRIGGFALARSGFQVQAREFERAGRYHFEVAVLLALTGLLIGYAGSLDVD